MTASLVYQSFGVLYGDLSTSPIYVFPRTSGRLKLHESDDDIVLGVLSLVFWTLTIIPLCKYIIFVLGLGSRLQWGNICFIFITRSTLQNEPFEVDLFFQYCNICKETKTSLLLKDLFEKHHSSRSVLFLVVLLRTSMVIGDGVLTPTMSVLSAVSGWHPHQGPKSP
ncbi:hypothetical protein MRB53_018725 [Persea americana]|uniref:Uncharacterized protein n=1 Tax=Persea americana TaxID=3435 RepID=A0ACC2M8T6_PERAE|nr:hypothetical protein MRB53_018725 [Persea americana]